MISAHRFVLPGLAVSLALALGACAKREDRVTLGYRDQIIHIGNLGEPNDLDPAYPDSQQTANIVMALFEGLAHSFIAARNQGERPRDRPPTPTYASPTRSITRDARGHSVPARSCAPLGSGGIP